MRYFVIAECGINHLGDMALAKKMIDASIDAGADAVKFQFYSWADIQDEFEGAFGLFEAVKSSQLSLDQLTELRDYTQKHGLSFVCTPFKKPSMVSMLAGIKPDAIKIRYKDFSIRMVELALKHDVPLVLASCPAPPIEHMGIYYSPRARWLYCLPFYPPKPEHFQAAMTTGFHGISDHYPHNAAALLAASLTRMNEYIIEKHVMLRSEALFDVTQVDYCSDLEVAKALSQKLNGKSLPDLPVSISFKQLKELVDYLRLFEKLRPSELYFPRPPRTTR